MIYDNCIKYIDKEDYSEEEGILRKSQIIW